MSTPAEGAIAAALAADRQQAEYFRGELARQRELLNDQMIVHEDALQKYQRRGELNQVRRIRREMRHVEHDRATLHWLLDRLDRRFPRHALKAH